MARTYEPIASTTLGTSAAAISFTAIPATYTDLRLVFRLVNTTGTTYAYLKFNNSSSSLASGTGLDGTGSSAVSYRDSGTSAAYISGNVGATTEAFIGTIDIMSYADTNVFKTWLVASGRAGRGVSRFVGLWRSTSAIDRIDITDGGGDDFASGSTVALYGIKAA